MNGLKQNSIPSFAELNEVAAIGNGGKIVFATDDWFANAENMISDTEPVFIADKYTDYGKWMDGWETRRKRIPGHDWCIIKLGAPCIIKGVMVDTAFFTGNYAPRISIQGVCLTENEEENLPERVSGMGTACTESDKNCIGQLQSEHWTELVGMTKMRPGYEESRKNYIPIDGDQICTYIRLNVFPDGGIARLRVYGDVQPNLNHLINSNDCIDLIAFENGGSCVSYSNAHYGHPRNLIKPGYGINMGDGWETMRRLDRPPILEADEYGMLQVPGHEWAIMKMCAIGEINNIVVDTKHFKGNFPDSIKIEGLLLIDDNNNNNNSETFNIANTNWITVLPNQKLSAHREHLYHDEIKNIGKFNYLRITMAPDGGVSRVRVFGFMSPY